MERLRIGRSIRALRIRLAQRQSDAAEKAGVSRSVVSRIERGEISSTTLESLEAVCAAIGADLDVRVRWRGEGLDRLMDEAHAGIVERFVRDLREAGWGTALEVTFNEYGERGSVDAVGWHPATRSLLISEVKSVIPDAQATLMPLDRKARLGMKIGRSQGWDPTSVSRVLVVRDGSTNRRRVELLSATFDAAFRVRGAEFRRWLRAPGGSIAALVFLPDSPQRSTRRSATGQQRVNRPRKAKMWS
jgi:transcriptional regulator with XRE-family HTH domain